MEMELIVPVLSEFSIIFYIVYVLLLNFNKERLHNKSVILYSIRTVEFRIGSADNNWMNVDLGWSTLIINK